DAKARFALRIALVQALAMDTAPHAAIATALPLVEGGPRRLVHGVFGSLMRAGAALPAIPSLPSPVADRWGRNWGDAVADEASKLLAAPPPLDLSFAGELPADMEGVSLLPGHLRIPGRTAVAGLTGYGEGRWWVQDLAASIPARLLGAGAGRTALDLCAAPGGKTMQLAAAGFAVTAVDASESRLARLSENLARTRLSAEVVAADILRWEPPGPVDAILLDAPCSATGTIRRHPDVPRLKRPRDVTSAADLQERLLAQAASLLKPGGRLVFATCSLQPEEGEAHLARAPAHGLAHEPFAPAELPELPRAITPGGWLRTRPDMVPGGMDGFFAARFRRG
ncbi:MAG TPA: RsmB/NOP family class I SAM-dependent RNA methyltransferase, partial [Acetobacteraceae bacterium]|nr:RsmB/NOP family class I SAM-dependent RNA methyltransferase [Acetobacteraceae bacterium]